MSKRLSGKEQDQMLVDLALLLKNWLKKEGCCRKADNQDPLTRSKAEICEVLDISFTMFRSVRFKAWEMGIPLVYHHYKEYNNGYYIGTKGEEARMLSHAQAVLRGLGESVFDGLFALGQAGTMRDAERYSRQMLGQPLNNLPTMLKALGSPLPQEATKVLTSGD